MPGIIRAGLVLKYTGAELVQGSAGAILEHGSMGRGVSVLVPQGQAELLGSGIQSGTGTCWSLGL